MKAMQAKMYCSLAWSLFSFAMTQSQPKEPWTPYLTDAGWVIKTDTGEELLIEDAPKDSPVYKKVDPVSYKAGEFIGAVADGQASYAKILWHHIVIVYAFGARIPFEPKGRKIKDVEKITSQGLLDNPKAEGVVAPDGKFFVNEHLAYTEALGSILTGLAPIFNPTSTMKSLTTDPKAREVREKRIKENEGRLHDPAVISTIKNEQIEMDKAWVKGDESENFYITAKAFDQVRVKMLCMHGEESAFTDGTRVTFIPTSLDEGLNLDYMPEYANAVRQASFNRGSETARGGELVQFLTRIFQNHSLDTSVDDCGTKRFLRRTIRPVYADWYVGLNIFEGGKTVLLTNDNISQYAGKEVALRTPQFCRSPGNSYCRACIGESNAQHPDSFGGQASDLGSTILYVFMKKAHGGALKTVAFDIELDIY